MRVRVLSSHVIGVGLVASAGDVLDLPDHVAHIRIRSGYVEALPPEAAPEPPAQDPAPAAGAPSAPAASPIDPAPEAGALAPEAPGPAEATPRPRGRAR